MTMLALLLLVWRVGNKGRAVHWPTQQAESSDERKGEVRDGWQWLHAEFWMLNGRAASDQGQSHGLLLLLHTDRTMTRKAAKASHH
mmetsp:Transcript_39675/g.112560  ORF Transcript_39675/g.112560 Transcript_39675/m.112560 type:complete len:86 (-) Transcript_39675:1081-1338(-)